MSCETGLRRGQRGTTLIESLVALGLFALVAVAMGTLMTSQMKMQGTNGTATTAVALAAKELEDLRAMDYSQLPSSRSSTTRVGSVTFTVSSTLQADNPASGMTSINTTVSWSEPLGSKSYTANAIYTDVTR